MILVLAKAVAYWLHSLSGNQHDTAFCTLHAPCRYSDHGALSLSQSKDFFDSGVYVRFLRSHSGQKNRCGGHHFFLILPGYRVGIEPFSAFATAIHMKS